MELSMIGRAEQFLKDAFDQSAVAAADAAYRIEHSYRVANIARQIAAKEGLDETAAAIAGLLHDIAYAKDLKTREEQHDHGRLSAAMARPFLTELGLPEATVNDICYGIAIHVDDEADFVWQRSTFAETVSDADNIDRFDAYRIYEGLAFVNFRDMTLDEKKKRVESMLTQLENLRTFPMATATARKLWAQRIEYYISFYEKLRSQLTASSTVQF